MANDRDYESNILGSILKYIVLPVAAISIIWYVVSNYLFGAEARQAAVDQITQVWSEYDREYKEFSAKGSITPEEEKILSAKLDLLKAPIQKIADSIPDPNAIAISIGGMVIAAITLYEVAKHAGAIGSQLRQFWNNITGIGAKDGSIGSPTGYDNSWTYSTSDELGLLFRYSAIMDIADSGNITLASNLLTAEQSAYRTTLVPEMQTSYNILAAQLPLLQGMQLALAQYMLSELSLFTQIYSVTLPPIFNLIPPII